MKFVAGFLMAVMAPALAHAQPVYLECTLTGMQWNVTLNEDTSMVSWEFPSQGRSYSQRGMFTADKVSWNGIAISRSNLTITRYADGELIAKDDVGQCKLVQKKNAF